MERRKKEHGSLNSQGGALLSVLLAIFLFSFLLLNLTTSYHQTADLVERTEHLYRSWYPVDEGEYLVKDTLG